MVLVKNNLEFLKGAKLRVEITPGFDQKQNLWVDDVIEIFVNDQPAAYMCLSMIPEDVFQKEFERKTIDWLIKIRGYRHLLPEPFDTEKLNANVCKHFGLPQNASKFRIKSALKRKYETEYDIFVNFHVGKRWVAYAETYNGTHNPTVSRTLNKRQSDQPEAFNSINYRATGLGQTLYQTAALWLSEQGENLYSDTTQTESARRMWEKLKEKFPWAIGYDHYSVTDNLKVRYYLDGSNLKNIIYPEWVSSVEVVYTNNKKHHEKHVFTAQEIEEMAQMPELVLNPKF